MLLVELGEVYCWLLVLRGLVSLSRVCMFAQVVWKGSLSPRTLPQLSSKAGLISFPQILYMYFCTLLLQFLPVDRLIFFFFLLLP